MPVAAIRTSARTGLVRRGFVLRAGRAVTALAVAALLLVGGIGDGGHGSERGPQWQAPDHQAVLSDTGGAGRADALLTGKPHFEPHPLSAACTADTVASSRARTVLGAVRPGLLPSPPRLFRRVVHADGDPPA